MFPTPATDFAEEYMFGDQRFAARRSDVLTYVSDPLPEDLTILGPVSAHLQAATTGSDADFDVKVIDVFHGTEGASSSAVQLQAKHDQLPIPGDNTAGYQQLVRGEPMRARFRNSWEKPEAMRPSQITPVNFAMPDVNYTFLKGHRIMVQIQSSWFPMIDLNPQSFVNTATAKPSDFVKAMQRVYHSPAAASSISIGVLPGH